MSDVVAEVVDGVVDTPEAVVEPVVEAVVVPSWKDSLPDDIKGEAGFDRFEADTLAKSYEKLYQSYRSAESKLGQKGVIKPKEGADDKEVAEYYKALGKPDTADKYEVTAPEGAEASKEFTDTFKDIMLKSNISQEQADSLYKETLLMEQASKNRMADEATNTFNEASTELKREWGQDFAGNGQLVVKAVENFGGDGAKEYLEKNPEIANDPFLAKLIYSMAKNMSEDAISKGGVSALVTTPAQARVQLSEIDGNKEHPYWKGDRDAMKLYQGLIAVAEGIKQ